MKHMLASKISFLASKIQSQLFPILDEYLETPNLKCHEQVLWALEIVQIEKIIPHYICLDRGRPPKHHACIARAFIAKHVLNLPSTSHLIYRLHCDKNLRYICGWLPMEKIPSEATFCRVFAFLSASGKLDAIHEKLVKEIYENHLVLHCYRDSCPIEVREREKKSDQATEQERYPCRSSDNKQLTVCEYQSTQARDLEDAIKHLKTECNIGKKTNSYGLSKCWSGYKLHLDVADGMFPISCILTSASTHDSQAGIPLSMKSSLRATVLYELMDSAYDVNAIKDYISGEGRVPLVKPHKRKGKRKETIEANETAYRILNWQPVEETRLKHRFSGERIFARLYDSFLCGMIWVRGHAKVFCHVMLGILALFCSELNRFQT
jgi:hypothetical protein